VVNVFNDCEVQKLKDWLQRKIPIFALITLFVEILKSLLKKSFSKKSIFTENRESFGIFWNLFLH
jgi:hypothetical protein